MSKTKDGVTYEKKDFYVFLQKNFDSIPYEDRICKEDREILVIALQGVAWFLREYNKKEALCDYVKKLLDTPPQRANYSKVLRGLEKFQDRIVMLINRKTNMSLTQLETALKSFGLRRIA